MKPSSRTGALDLRHCLIESFVESSAQRQLLSLAREKAIAGNLNQDE